ncbi:MAG: cupin domain-containing protein [Rhodanobacteraceae bacterium]
MTSGSSARDYLPARFTVPDGVPWIPSATPGKSSKPLRFLSGDRGFVELLRMEPGVAMPLHRHTGEIHACNLRGSRRLCTGEIIGPGDYVFEPPGNTDWWKIVGDDVMEALVVVMGTVEFLNADGTVRATVSATTQFAEYQRHCRDNKLAVCDLVD